MKQYLVLGLVVIIFLLSFSPVFAIDENIGQSKLTPASPIYFLKTIREDLELKLAGTEKTKLIRYLEFSTRRLREAKSLAGTGSEDLIQPTLEHFWKNLNSVLEANPPMDESLIPVANHVVGRDLVELMALYANVKPLAKTSIRATVNKLVQYQPLSVKLRVPACNFLLKESSSSALTQSQQVIWKQRAQDCFLIKE